jgi:enoyl-CoA hydratase
MDYTNITYAVDGPIATLTINRPAVLNALNHATIAEIGAALAAAEADGAVRVVVITGAGERAFAAGADINELQAIPSANAGRRFSEQSHRLGFEIAAMSKPVLAAINGFALGGGLELALACDIRLASSTAQVGQPEILLGIIPGWGGTQRLPRLIGPGAARLLCMTGERIGAEEALRLGIVERVFPAESFHDDVLALARTLAERPPLALAAVKQAIGRGMNMGLEEGCMYEAALFGDLAATEDAKEGTSAFLEKRKAGFSGR